MGPLRSTTSICIPPAHMSYLIYTYEHYAFVLHGSIVPFHYARSMHSLYATTFSVGLVQECVLIERIDHWLCEHGYANATSHRAYPAMFPARHSLAANVPALSCWDRSRTSILLLPERQVRYTIHSTTCCSGVQVLLCRRTGSSTH